MTQQVDLQDGGLQRGASLLDTVLPTPPRQPISVGMGICDPDHHSERQAAELWRYSKTLIPFTNDGTKLFVTAGSSFSSFVAGTNESGATQGYAAGYNLSLSETDADKAGSMIKLNDLFEVRAIGFEVLRPYAQGASGQAQYEQSFQDAGYINMLMEAVYDHMALQVVFDDSACNFVLGLGRMHPPHASVANAINTGRPQRNSVGMVSVTPIRPFITGARDQENKAQLALTIGPEIDIASNPIIPLPTSGSVPTVVVPVLIHAYGEKVCPPKQCADEICDTPEAQAKLLAMMQQLMNAQGAAAPARGLPRKR